MTIQLVDIFYPNVFRRYSAKYNIFRDLYERDLQALEIRGLQGALADRVKKIILLNKEICYSTSVKPNAQADLLALGSYGVFKELAKEIVAIGNEDLGYKVSKVIKNITDYENGSAAVGRIIFNLNAAHVMGIVNVTPDSFSDGGQFFDTRKAVDHALKLVEEGASIIDIGGESTRPGSQPVSAEEEISRVLPVISEVKNLSPDTIISIDTTKSEVAAEALKHGAKIVNDISAGLYDQNMFKTVRENDAAIILMHMKGTPATMQETPVYEDVVSEIYDFLIERTEQARKAGIKTIFVDPGIGFGKRVFDNYELIKRLNEFKGIGCPILVGLSRKSFLGKALNIDIEERQNPTLIAESLAIKNGARFIRTHEVKNAVLASRLNNFIENPELLKNV